MKTLIPYNINNQQEPQHSIDVANAFVAGGGVNYERYGISGNISQSMFDYARNNGFNSIIWSYSGLTSYTSLAESNLDIMLFMPTHDEIVNEKQQIVVTESHQDSQGNNGYFEFQDNTQTADSYSNGYICGQLFDIAKQRNCSLQEARIVANLTKDTDKYINVANAVNYTGEIKLSGGQLSASKTLTDLQLNMSIDRITDSSLYIIQIDNIDKRIYIKP